MNCILRMPPSLSATICVLSIFWCGSFAFGQSSSPPTGLRAGAATANITPPLDALVVGGFSPQPAETVHDELHVRCLVLDDGKTRLAIVLCDNVGIPREVFDAAKKQIFEKTGLPVENQLMAATHTHSAVSARGNNSMVYDSQLNDYQQFLSRRIVDGVRIAIKRLEPARIAWGAIDEPSQLFNRRWYVENDADRRNPFGGVDKVRMNPGSAGLIKPAGPIDPQLSFVSVQSTAGKPIAILGNYSLHYVGGVSGNAISGDYFAVFANHLAKLMGVTESDPPFVGIMSNGTSGDVNNINRIERSPRYEPYQKMREVGQLLAGRVVDSLKSANYVDNVSLAAQSEELALRVRKPDAALMKYIDSVLAKPKDDKPFHQHERTYAERVKQLASSPDEIKIQLQVLRVGSLGIAAIPFEVFTETGLEIKERSPMKSTFTIELANGSYGYLPTPAQHELGGYETWMGTNRVEVKASEKIVDRLMAMFNQVKQ